MVYDDSAFSFLYLSIPEGKIDVGQEGQIFSAIGYLQIRVVDGNYPSRYGSLKLELIAYLTLFEGRFSERQLVEGRKLEKSTIKVYVDRWCLWFQSLLEKQ